jgi:hypothetical protein
MTSTVTLRICGPEDGDALRRLAGRDSAPPLEGTVLLAEVAGEPRAAIALETGRVVADPFALTAELVDLLRARAKQLEQRSRPWRSAAGGVGRFRASLPRLARQAAR